jgi:hypothetical protein
MDSWWQLGEHSGKRGNDLDMSQITCPFCMEDGNFEVEHKASKKQPNGSKVLHFDTLKCGNCSSYVQVFWSAGSGLHDLVVQPRVLKIDRAPKQYPEAVGRFWLQAKRNLLDQNWDAAAVMARSALQLTLRSHDAEGNNLYQEIEYLTSKGLLPPLMSDWAHNVRELGNDSAHPAPDQPPTTSRDASDIVSFLDFLLQYLYTLPMRIEEYRGRKTT